MSIKQQLVHAIEEMPESVTAEDAVERLYLLYKIRRGLAQPEPARPDTAQQIMSLAGSWADMPAEQFEDFSRELVQRRGAAFMRRRVDEGSAD